MVNVNATNKRKDLNRSEQFKSLKITSRCGQVLHSKGHLHL